MNFFAGGRPGSRTTFVSAKVVKTIDAPFGLIWMGLMQINGGRTNSLCSNKVRRFMGASDPGADRQASDREDKADFQMRYSAETSLTRSDILRLDIFIN